MFHSIAWVLKIHKRISLLGTFYELLKEQTEGGSIVDCDSRVIGPSCPNCCPGHSLSRVFSKVDMSHLVGKKMCGCST